jgi:hypothetical protein
VSENVTFSEAPGRSASPGQIVAKIGIASIGAADTVVVFEAGQVGQVDEIGYGALPASSRRNLRHGANKTIAVLSDVDTAGTVSAVTKTGSGPTVTCAAIATLGDQIEGPWFAFPALTLTVVREGALGEARAEFSYDGVTLHETVDILPSLPATLIGSVDLTGITPADLDTLTFDLSSVDGANPAAVTFASVTTVAHIVSQVDAIVGVTASLVGGRYLKITATTLGSTGILTNASGTANTLLGFTAAQTAAGVNSTYDPPGVGVRFTFPTGDYELDTTYEVTTESPTMGTVDFEAAAAALRASGEPFSVLHVLHEPVDGIDLAAWQTALESFRVELATAEDNPVFFKWILGGPLAPVADWDDIDTDVKLTLAGTQTSNKFNTIVHGDVYLDWIEYSGRHRTQLAHCYVEECARNALNVNPGLGSKGPLRNAYLKDLNGDAARTEAEALIKLQDHGFSVLRDDKQEPYIRAGRTRAPSVSQFTGEHTARAALECGRVMRELAFGYSNSTPALGKDGQLSATDKANIEGKFNFELQETIVKLGYASSAKAIVLGLVTVGGSDRLLVKGIFQRLANVVGVDITVFVTDSLEFVEGIQ